MHINEFKLSLIRFSTYFGGILSVIFWILLIYGFDEPYAAGLTLLCALIHEFGHVTVTKWRRGGRVRGVLSGLRLGGMGVVSYNEDFAFAAAGPIANIISALLALPFLPHSGEYGYAFVSLSLATAFANLLPIRGHDGFNMLYAMIGKNDISGSRLRCLETVSFVITVTLCFASLYIMDRFGEGYWAFGVFFISALSELARRQ